MPVVVSEYPTSRLRCGLCGRSAVADYLIANVTEPINPKHIGRCEAHRLEIGARVDRVQQETKSAR